MDCGFRWQASTSASAPASTSLKVYVNDNVNANKNMLTPDEPPVVFGGYLIPLVGHEDCSGESIQYEKKKSRSRLANNTLIATKSPSMTDPFKWKYQLIAFNVLPSQVSAGVKPYLLC